MDAIEKLKSTVESLIEERDTLREDRDRLIEEAKELVLENSKLSAENKSLKGRMEIAAERANKEQVAADKARTELFGAREKNKTLEWEVQELMKVRKSLREERDEARKCAEEIRDLCVGVFPFPWEQGGSSDV